MYHDNQYESAIPEPTDGPSRRKRSPNKWHGSILFTDNATLRHGQPECIGFAEIDRFASSIYKYHWPDVRNYGDATAIVCDELPDFDFLVAGFPCQSFSIAGKRQGFNEARGTLFFEIARILSHKRPRHFLLENVKGLLSSDDGKVYTTILRILSDLDYRVETVVLNSKHYGVPQNRERVFFIGHLSDGCSGEVLSFGDGDGEFDGQYGQAQNISSCLDANYYKGNSNGFGGLGRQTVSLTPSEVQVGTWRTHKDGQGFREVADGNCPTLPARAREDGSGQAVIAIPVLTPDRPTKRQDGRRFKDDGDEAFTLTSQDRHGVMVQAIGGLQEHQTWRDDGISPSLTEAMGKGGGQTPMVRSELTNRRIRRLTPTECERLQGLPDGHTKYGINDKGNVYEVSDSQRYKTLGNAMTVNVIEAIVTRMIQVGCLDGNEEAHRTNVLPVV